MHENTSSMEAEGAKGAAPLGSSDAKAPRAVEPSDAVGVREVVGLVVERSVANDPPRAEVSSLEEPSPSAVVPLGPRALRDEVATAVGGGSEGAIPAPPAPPAPRERELARKKQQNNLRKLRIERMMSKAELARRANLSVLTIDRIEKGFGCRMDSKRKILEALGLSLADRVRVFGEEE